jgi:hypothetical protein
VTLPFTQFVPRVGILIVHAKLPSRGEAARLWYFNQVEANVNGFDRESPTVRLVHIYVRGNDRTAAVVHRERQA